MPRSTVQSRVVTRRQRIGWPGALYLLTTCLLALGAVNGQNNLLFWAFGLAIAGLLISGVVGGMAILGVQIERVVLAEATAGEPVTISYRVWNRSRVFPACCLLIEESPTADRSRPKRKPQVIVPGRAAVLHVGPREAVVAFQTWIPRARGPTSLDRIVVSSAFPFGLMRKSILLSQPDTVLVRPAKLALRRDLLQSTVSRGALGHEASRRVGRGEEYFGLREYRPGDSPREIAWKPSARTGELVVRERSAPVPRRVWVVLNPSGSPQENEVAIALAASLLREGSRQGLAMGLTIPARGVSLAPRVGAVRSQVEALASLDLAAPHLPADLAVRSSPRDSYIAVHASEIDRAAAPASAAHLSARAAGSWLAPHHALPEFLSAEAAA